jgi:hypothetical protein
MNSASRLFDVGCSDGERRTLRVSLERRLGLSGQCVAVTSDGDMLLRVTAIQKNAPRLSAEFVSCW